LSSAIFFDEKRCLQKKDCQWKLTKRLASGIKLWKFYFQSRARCALMSAFDKIAGKKLQANVFFCRRTFFSGKHFFQANASTQIGDDEK
jgi:hypothetical protein